MILLPKIIIIDQVFAKSADIISPLRAFFDELTFKSIENYATAWEQAKKTCTTNLALLLPASLCSVTEQLQTAVSFLHQFGRVALFGTQKESINICFEWHSNLSDAVIKSTNLELEKFGLFLNLTYLHLLQGKATIDKPEYTQHALLANSLFVKVLECSQKLLKTNITDPTWLNINQLITEGFLYSNPEVLVRKFTNLVGATLLIKGSRVYETLLTTISKASKTIKKKMEPHLENMVYNRDVLKYHAYSLCYEHYVQELKSSTKCMGEVIGYQMKKIELLAKITAPDNTLKAQITAVKKQEASLLKQHIADNLKFGYFADTKDVPGELLPIQMVTKLEYEYSPIELKGLFINAKFVRDTKEKLIPEWKAFIESMKNKNIGLDEAETKSLSSVNLDIYGQTLPAPMMIEFTEFIESGGVEYYVSNLNQLSDNEEEYIKNECNSILQLISQNKINYTTGIGLKIKISDINSFLLNVKNEVKKSIEKIQSFKGMFSTIKEDIDNMGIAILTVSLTAMQEQTRNHITELGRQVYFINTQRLDLISSISNLEHVIYSIAHKKAITTDKQMLDEIQLAKAAYMTTFDSLNSDKIMSEISSVLSKYYSFADSRKNSAFESKFNDFHKKLKCIEFFKKEVDSIQILYETLKHKKLGKILEAGKVEIKASVVNAYL